MKIAIDFDGVIHDYMNPKAGRRMGEPIVGAKEALTKMRADGHEIIIFTVRAKNDADTKVVHDWMIYYSIPFDTITNIKQACDVYIDDKAIRFTSWGDICI